jgi:hypothetical protein
MDIGNSRLAGLIKSLTVNLGMFCSVAEDSACWERRLRAIIMQGDVFGGLSKESILALRYRNQVERGGGSNRLRRRRRIPVWSQSYRDRTLSGRGWSHPSGRLSRFIAQH